MDDNLIILAAGASSRMKQQINTNISLSNEELQQANKRSKALISIDVSGRPILDYVLYNAKKAGYKNIYIVTQKENELFKSLYQDNDRFRGMTIRFAIQYIPNNREKPLGTADALCQTLEQYSDLKKCSFTVCNSDNLYSVKAFQLLRENKTAPNALISYDRDALQFSEERISRFALMLFDKGGHLNDIIEKPSLDQLHNFKDSDGKLRVSMNIFKFDGNMFFNYLKNCPVTPNRNEKELPTALLNMVREHPMSTIGIPLSEHVPDLTSKEDILILKEYIKNISL
jgi:NDP-sugar pyrophosphorylase family protein